MLSVKRGVAKGERVKQSGGGEGRLKRDYEIEVRKGGGELGKEGACFTHRGDHQ